MFLIVFHAIWINIYILSLSVFRKKRFIDISQVLHVWITYRNIFCFRKNRRGNVGIPVEHLGNKLLWMEEILHQLVHNGPRNLQHDPVNGPQKMFFDW